MENKKVTIRQMVLMLTTFRINLVISYMPSLRVPPGNQDIWIMILLSFFYSILLRIPLLYLANKFSNISIIKYLQKVWGKTLGKAIGFTYALYFALYTTFIIILQAQLVGADILPRTSNVIIMIILIIVSLYIGSKGLVLMCWLMELISPIVLSSILALVLLGLKNVDFRILLPILSDSSLYDINIGALIFSFVITDIFVLVIGVPYLENEKDINKIYLRSSIYSLIINAITVIVTQGALGIEQAKHANYPFLIYTRLISYASFFERIDAVYVIVWISANIVRKSFYIYILYTVFKEVLNLRDNKIILYTIGILVGIIALYIANTQVLVIDSAIEAIVLYSSIIFITIIPLFTMIVYFFRKRTIEKEKIVQN